MFGPSRLTTVRKVKDNRGWRVRRPPARNSLFRGVIPCCHTERESRVSSTQEPRCNKAGILLFQSREKSISQSSNSEMVHTVGPKPGWSMCVDIPWPGKYSLTMTCSIIRPSYRHVRDSIVGAGSLTILVSQASFARSRCSLSDLPWVLPRPGYHVDSPTANEPILPTWDSSSLPPTSPLQEFVQPG